MQRVYIEDLEDGSFMKVFIDDKYTGVEVYTKDPEGNKCAMIIDKKLFKRFCLDASKLCKVRPVKTNHVGLVTTTPIKELELCWNMS
jgi:hypothetical protein